MKDKFTIMYNPNVYACQLSIRFQAIGSGIHGIGIGKMLFRFSE